MPIVMLVSGDAVATGVVASLARPGGNVTGSTFFDPELHAKRLELVSEAWPSAARIAVLFNPGNQLNAALMRAMQLTASSLKLELRSFEARSPDEFADVLAKAAAAGVEVIAATSDAVIRANARRLAEIATSHRIPSIGDSDSRTPAA